MGALQRIQIRVDAFNANSFKPIDRKIKGKSRAANAKLRFDKELSPSVQLATTLLYGFRTLSTDVNA